MLFLLLELQFYESKLAMIVMRHDDGHIGEGYEWSLGRPTDHQEVLGGLRRQAYHGRPSYQLIKLASVWMHMCMK